MTGPYSIQPFAIATHVIPTQSSYVIPTLPAAAMTHVKQENTILAFEYLKSIRPVEPAVAEPPHLKGRINCDQCDKDFSTNQTLTTHIRRAHTGREKVCTVCKKRFPNTGDLSRHRETHLKSKTCDDCDITFQERYQLISHNKKLHPEIYFHCPFHPETPYSSRRGLSNHAKKVHKKSVSELFDDAKKRNIPIDLPNAPRKYVKKPTTSQDLKSNSTSESIRVHTDPSELFARLPELAMQHPPFGLGTKRPPEPSTLRKRKKSEEELSDDSYIPTESSDESYTITVLSFEDYSEVSINTTKDESSDSLDISESASLLRDQDKDDLPIVIPALNQPGIVSPTPVRIVFNDTLKMLNDSVEDLINKSGQQIAERCSLDRTPLFSETGELPPDFSNLQPLSDSLPIDAATPYGSFDTLIKIEDYDLESIESLSSIDVASFP